MFKILLSALFFAAAVLVYAEEESVNEFEVKPDYVFVNKGGRDPFWPKHFKSEAVIMESTDIANFMILGITESNGEKAVLFKNKSGANTGYVFMGGKLYGDNDKVIEDVSGEFKSDNEVILRQGDREVLFTIGVSGGIINEAGTVQGVKSNLEIQDGQGSDGGKIQMYK